MKGGGESIADRHRGKQRKGSRKNTDTSSCSLQQCLEHLLKKEILNENSQVHSSSLLHLFFISSSSLLHLFFISFSSPFHLLIISSSSAAPWLSNDVKFGFQLLLNIELSSFLCHLFYLHLFHLIFFIHLPSSSLLHLLFIFIFSSLLFSSLLFFSLSLSFSPSTPY